MLFEKLDKLEAYPTLKQQPTLAPFRSWEQAAFAEFLNIAGSARKNSFRRVSKHSESGECGGSGQDGNAVLFFIVQLLVQTSHGFFDSVGDDFFRTR